MKAFELSILIVVGIFLIYKYVQVSNIDKDSVFVSSVKGIILDVRTNMEYKNSHVENSINITMGDILNGEYKNLDKEQKYYVYCSLGLRSIRVSNFLRKKGFKKVINCGPMSEVSKYINAKN